MNKPVMENGKRQAANERKTNETAVFVSVDLDDASRRQIDTGVGIFDHMLDLLAFWAGFGLEISSRGDLHIDAHHLMEDTGLVLGKTFREALGSKAGIARAGFGRVPMDEALVSISLDLSGRPWLEWRNDEILPPIIAGQEKDVWREFYKSFVASGKFNLHVDFLYGKNGHHLLESAAKGVGVALRQAVQLSGTGIKSTKGELE